MPGFIKIHRKITEWEWYPDINTTRLFIHLLLTANHKDKKYKGKIIPRGSLATTIPKLSEETALTIKEVRTALNHLKTTFEVGIQTTNRESIINVHNYDVYQSRDDDEGQAKGRQRAVERQSKGVRTEEEDKEDKEGKKEISSSAEPPSGKFSNDSDEMKLCLLLADRMHRNNPDCKLPDDFQGWCKHVDLMIRIDGRTPKQIQDVILFCQKDAFWQSVILSTKKLREKYDQLSMKMQAPETRLQKQSGKSFTEIIAERTGKAV